mmetsp:Transcript_33439/g.59453  ORF Transcript_33439/g.59453 Transcript_33439/m.59453 type:complete len:400 (-) Transcript_33439:43-1242(-)
MSEDIDRQIEDKLRELRQNGAARHVAHKEEETEECAVCFGVLCEPVAWPDCSHYYCFRCMLKMRQRLRPACPLCRRAASHVQESWEIQVDQARAHLVRYSVGYSKYEAMRREVWSEVAEMELTKNLGTMPLMCTGWCDITAGSSFVLPIFEPRYQAMVSRAEAPGGSCRFMLITHPADPQSGAVFEAGSMGRVCEIVEVQQHIDGPWPVKVEAGMACRVIEVTTEEIGVGAPPLFHGLVEKVQEEELSSGIGRDVVIMDALERSRLVRRLLSRVSDIEQNNDALANATTHSSGPPSGSPPDRRLQRAMYVMSSMDRIMQGARSLAGRSSHQTHPLQATNSVLHASRIARNVLAQERDAVPIGLRAVRPLPPRRSSSPSEVRGNRDAVGSWRTAGRLSHI